MGRGEHEADVGGEVDAVPHGAGQLLHHQRRRLDEHEEVEGDDAVIVDR